MTDLPDARLLELFAWNGSEEAFAALVRRHIGLVHSVALRHMANPQQAEDITQAVFIILARKAGTLGHKTVLPGWLYHTARLTAANLQRAETRRVRREQEAFMQSDLEEPATDALWRVLSPQLDEAMAGLGTVERDALVLRYFQNKSMAEVGVSLGLAENAAQKRVGRALDKLRRFFAKRGVDSTAGHIADTISTHSVQAVPAALVKTVTAAALAKGAAASTSTLSLIKGALKIMAWTKMKTAAVIGIGVLLAVSATTTTVLVVKKANADAVENYFANWGSMDINTAALPPVIVLRPTKYANKGDWIIASSDLSPEGRLMRRNASFPEILSTAYGFSTELIILPATLPRGRFDLLLTTTKNSREMLRAEIKRQFGIVAHTETRDGNVLVLKVSNPNAPGLKISADGGPNTSTDRGSLKLVGFKMPDIAHVIGTYYNQPVIDETGLTATYDIDAHWNGNLTGSAMRKEIENMMRDQFGLELTPDRRPVEMLVVEKAK